ncbi:MAG TPA: hypothetical protein VFC51_00480 [Chloroflexota bacterium]|nr:hypothetical protein [Chloroflexota bacterium]
MRGLRLTVIALAAFVLMWNVAVSAGVATAASLCLYPGIPQTWTTDTAVGTVTFTLGADERGRPVVNVQAPDGSVATETIAPCGPDTGYAAAFPPVAPPAISSIFPNAHPHHHHHGHDR